MQASSARLAFEQRKRKLFESICNLSEEQQTRVLSTYLESEPELARAVRNLLRASRPESDGILSRPLYKRPEEASEHPKFIGRYRVERHVGNGGMGSIYACRDPQTGALVAVKMIRSDIQSQAAREHFKSERDILMRIHHPNICRILDANVADIGIPFIVMEFVDGKPLDRYCRDNSCDTFQTLLLFSQVLAGIDHLHAQNIVHRDLKPSNLLVTANGSVRILDFGIAKMVEHAKGWTGRGNTATKLPLMTVRYASPEQLTGKLSGRASDIYSLGVVCYELLTGTSPCPKESQRDPQLLYQALQQKDPPPPSSLPGKKAIGTSVDNLVLNALEFYPECRYSSVGLFLSDLRRYLEGGTVPRRRKAQGASVNA